MWMTLTTSCNVLVRGGEGLVGTQFGQLMKLIKCSRQANKAKRGGVVITKQGSRNRLTVLGGG